MIAGLRAYVCKYLVFQDFPSLIAEDYAPTYSRVWLCVPTENVAMHETKPYKIPANYIRIYLNMEMPFLNDQKHKLVEFTSHSYSLCL